jgi:putative addiction module killer protein
LYKTNGKEPFSDWLDKLKDQSVRMRILRRIDRLALGNYGDYRYISGKLFELKLDVGSGYRVYCGEDGKQLVILLCGGDKGSQSHDIARAKVYWQEYLQRRKSGKL